MALPTIIFDATTGNNLYSGAGPAAITGNDASFVGSDITLSGSPDLSSVNADGSHVIRLGTTTGRRWFKIIGVDDGTDTITVNNAPAGTDTGRDWGIGGTLEQLEGHTTTQLWNDLEDGWTVDFLATGPYEISNPLSSEAIGISNANGTKDLPITIKSSSVTPAVISWDGSAAASTRNVIAYLSTSAGVWVWDNLEIIQSGHNTSFKDSAIECYVAIATLHIKNCIVSGPSLALRSSAVEGIHMNISSSNEIVVIVDNCEFKWMGAAIRWDAGLMQSNSLIFKNNLITECGTVGGGGVLEAASCNFYITNNIFDSCNGLYNIEFTKNDSTNNSGGVCCYNTLYNPDADGIYIGYPTLGFAGISIFGNIIYQPGNGGTGYGINYGDIIDTNVAMIDYNCIYNPGTARYNNVVAIPENDISGDPLFVDAAGGDFNLQDNSPCKNTGVYNNSSFLTNFTQTMDVGAIQAAGASGGGGVIIINKKRIM